MRPATMADVDDWLALHSDPEAFPFAPDGPISTIEEAEDELGEYLVSWLNHGLGYWLARERETGDLVGAGGMRAIRLPNGDSVWKLYYRLVPAKTGNGFTPELVQAAVAQLARIDAQARVRAVMRNENAEAIRVVESLGLTPHGSTQNEAGQEQTVYQGVVGDLV
ncbi:GNAT family N-acetyltransferase [Aestuariimicrobium soli]|uniref:GNAT family N-acetyltransferase n=1 Tax=Aestuariimicrobium soli TaxID=2035834 RepID=UPI003EB7951A